MGLRFICILLLFSTNVGCKEIVQLPGLSIRLNFKHYSGYLNGSATHKLHYWFVESQNEPSSDPFLVWLNGGPGCSSLGGMLTELGPFRIADDGLTVRLNPYSWNKKANVLFLEAPAGVGYSYSTDGNITTDDDLVSLENYNALKEFLGTDFPQFRSNPLYITGESYGGVYVPTFMSRILDGQEEFHMNIQGMAVGNGLVSNNLNTDSLVLFAHAHGLVDEKLWNLMETSCCNGCADTCEFHSFQKNYCKNIVENITAEAWSQGLNVYDLYRDCYHPKSDALLHSRFQMELQQLGRYGNSATNTLQKLSQRGNTTPKQRPHLYEAPPCLNETASTDYLNRKDVRETLGIPSHLPLWSMCSDPVGNVYHRIYEDMFKQVTRVLRAKLRVLIYNGDTDMACNFLMGQQFSHQLQIPLLHSKQPWVYDEQIVGFVTNYKNLDFVTVKGAGHMVPQWRPGPALDMITKFLDKESLV